MKPASWFPAWLLGLLLLPVALAPGAAAEGAAGGTFDRWFVLTLQDQRAGWAHMTQRPTGDGHIETTSELRLALRRGPVAMEIEQSQRFEETPDGRPVAAESSMKMGAMAVVNRYRWTETGIENTTRQGTREQTKTLPPIEGEWLTPAAAQRHVERQIAEEAEEIRVRTLDLSMGIQPMEARMRVVGEQPVEVFGRTAPAVVWEATLASMPGVTMREYVDADGRTLKTRVSIMPGMDIEMIAADETLAKAELDPPEVLAALMIHPGAGSVEVDDPRELTQAVYEVAVKPGEREMRVDLPRTGYQRVVWGDERTARVVVDLSSPVNPEADVPGEEHLAASTMLNHEDEAVRALVAGALPGDDASLPPMEKALRLRRFVHDHMDQKTLAVGFATASEVARTREGDCSEHAVLLAALLRGAGIPSRTASGLLYVDEFIGERDVLGGHMWTQAWIDAGDGGRWVDLDATLPDPAMNGYDAAHITIAVSTLNDDRITNELVELAPLLGVLEVKIVAAGADAPAGAAAP